MTLEQIQENMTGMALAAQAALSRPETYTQLATVAVIYAVAWFLAGRIRRVVPLLDASQDVIRDSVLRKYVNQLSNLVFPLLAILILRISLEASQTLLDEGWVMQTALTIAVLLLAISIIN
ncbi:MAG: hypothetical protein RIC38_13170, partial [Chromatocurvus sp.]